MTLVPLLLIAAPMAPLTIDAAIDRALEVHEDARFAELTVEKAEAEYDEALASLFGRLQIDGTYRRRRNEARPNGAALALKNSLFGVARADLTVFDAQVLPEIGASSDRVEAAEQRRIDARRSLAFAVGETFLEVLAAERSSSAASRRAAIARKTAADVRARFDAGLAATNVLNRSKLELATAELEATRAANTARRIRLALGFLLAREVGEALVEPEIVAPPSSKAEQLASAIEVRPDLAALRISLEAARAEARAPMLGLIPSVAVSAEVTATNETGFANQVFNYNLAATLSWLVWDGGARYAVAAQRAAAVEEAQLSLEQQTRRVGLEIEQAAADVQTAAAAVVQAEARAEIADENAREVGARFVQGLASALEQADAAAEAYDAAQALARERFLAAAAALRFKRAVGDWPTDAR